MIDRETLAARLNEAAKDAAKLAPDGGRVMIGLNADEAKLLASLLTATAAAPAGEGVAQFLPTEDGEFNGNEWDGEALKPCPFCGGKAEIVHIDEGENAGGSCVCCTRCMASSNVEFEFKENFVSNWNSRRTTYPAAPDDVQAAGWCQPMRNGDHAPRQFIVRFEDADRGDAVFDDEDEAYSFWEKANTNWNCYLFGAMPLGRARQGGAT